MKMLLTQLVMRLCLVSQLFLGVTILLPAHATPPANLPVQASPLALYIPFVTVSTDNRTQVQYPDLMLNVERDDTRQITTLWFGDKSYQLQANQAFSFLTHNERFVYYKDTDLHLFVQRLAYADSYYYYLSVLDKQGKFYELGGFSLYLPDRNSRQYNHVALSVYHQGDTVSIYTDKNYTVSFQLK